MLNEVGLLEIGVLQHFEQIYLVVHIKRQCPVDKATYASHTLHSLHVIRCTHVELLIKKVLRVIK